jgi:hypothetical protein
MAILDPTRTRLSPHFLLSDMIGCQSVYAKGLPNVFEKEGRDIRLVNGKALCEHVLEPLVALMGSVSISYGFISPSLSREIVTYQDPNKPSHHRWDLGAAVDVCVHRQVLQSISNDNASPLQADWSSPIAFALEHLQELPLSRLITYSESPYICMAVSADEVARGAPRGAWYENRYTGHPKVKPQYIKYPTSQLRARAQKRIAAEGLTHGWEGAGYPTYHGGGRKQFQHMRVSDHTMVSDWLYDEQFVTEGVRNFPSLDNAAVMEGFKLAGEAYEYMLKVTGLPRISIVSAYTSHLSQGWMAGRDWRQGDVSFEIVPPEYLSPEHFIQEVVKGDTQMHLIFGHVTMVAEDDRVIVTVRRDIEW